MGSIQCTHIDRTFYEKYADYQWEMLQRKLIEMPWGFGIYGIHENYLFISDLYIEPRHRGQGIARRFLEEIEKVAGVCDRAYIGTKVSRLDKAWQNNIAICEHLGFARAKVNPEYIFLMKRRDL